MNFPRYTNPHFLAQTTRLVSRENLTRDSDVDDHMTDGDKEELRAHLDQLLSKRGLVLKRSWQTTDDATGRATRRRKRSKVSRDEASDPAAVEQVSSEH
jgi:hypothetical protein